MSAFTFFDTESADQLQARMGPLPPRVTVLAFDAVDDPWMVRIHPQATNPRLEARAGRAASWSDSVAMPRALRRWLHAFSDPKGLLRSRLSWAHWKKRVAQFRANGVVARLSRQVLVLTIPLGVIAASRCVEAVFRFGPHRMRAVLECDTATQEDRLAFLAWCCNPPEWYVG